MQNTTLQHIAKKFQKQQVQSFFVGGCVRDAVLGIDSDDIDICLVGVHDKNVVMQVLNQFATHVAEEVGNQFPVWIAEIEGIGKVDFALARTEKKTGESRKEFACQTQDVSIEGDLLRRDLTINAIAQNVLTGELVDPFGGVEHLQQGIAHPVSEAFAEDTLRVLRAARFMARFDLQPSKELVALCQKLKPTDISNERVGMELMKAMKQAKTPSTFFRFLKDVNWLQYHFQELQDLVGVPQDPIHHPEGDAFEHTMQTLDQATDWFTRVVMVCHDLGKATTTALNKKGRWSAIGHEEASVPLTENMLKRIHFADHKTIQKMATLVALHMVHTQTISEKVVRRTLRTLMDAGLKFEQLVEVCRCDVSGRGSKPKFTPEIGQERAKELLVQDLMTPVVTGKVLLSVGMKSGKEMGAAVKKALELQDRGTLNSENWFSVMKNSGLLLI